MSDDEDEEAEGPPVPLGDGEPVEGAPPARVASRLHYPIEKSTVREREGETTVRTPDGPRRLADVLEASDEVYFDRRQAFETAVREVVGVGTVPTANGDDAQTNQEEDDEAPDEVEHDEAGPDETGSDEADRGTK